jgi:site-specific DNA recombinase
MSNTMFEQTLEGYSASIPAVTRNTEYRRNIKTSEVDIKPQKIRTAAYARVSSETEMQDNSLENQIIYFTNHIRSNPKYHFIGVYSDKGKTGTKMDSRPGFMKLIRYALDGKVDLIYCKSISRFARNVVDTVETVRKLKAAGVRVIFEREGIDTGDIQSEFLLVTLSALAEEESRGISENLNWSYAKRFEKGEPVFMRILGYTKDKDKAWIIVEEEAEIVREAFNEYLNGLSPLEIARLFIKKGYKKKNGRTDWSSLAIKDTLKNERYVGDVMSQKTYTKDPISHKTVVNRGERPQYLISNHHEPIIDRETFDRVQEMLANNTKKGLSKAKNTYPLSGRIICGDCGENFHRFSCRNVVTWRCSNHTKSNMLCEMEGVKEKDILDAIVTGFKRKYQISKNKVNKETVINLIKEINNCAADREFQQSNLRVRLEKALLDENAAILKGNDEGLKELTNKRLSVEKEITEKENWWDLFDKDDEYRKEALNALENMKNLEARELIEQIKDIKFLRAWVVRIKVLSPFSFAITWLTGKETKITINKKGR